MEYPIGTICVYQNFIAMAHLNDTECVIVGPLETRFVIGRITGPAHHRCYMTEGANGRLAAEPKNLRRKDPPTTGEDAILSLFINQPEHESA